MVEPINCQFVSFDEIFNMTKELAFKVADSGYEPELLLAIARSGFVPGRLMSDFLGNSDLYALKVEHWLDTTAEHMEDAIIPVRPEPDPVQARLRRHILQDFRSGAAGDEKLQDHLPGCDHPRGGGPDDQSFLDRVGAGSHQPRSFPRSRFHHAQPASAPHG